MAKLNPIGVGMFCGITSTVSVLIVMLLFSLFMSFFFGGMIGAMSPQAGGQAGQMAAAQVATMNIGNMIVSAVFTFVVVFFITAIGAVITNALGIEFTKDKTEKSKVFPGHQP